MATEEEERAEFSLIYPGVFSQTLINIKDIPLNGQQYEQTNHQYNELISSEQAKIQEIISKNPNLLPKLEPKSISPAQKLINEYDPKIDSFNQSFSAFVETFKPLALVPNIEFNQQRLDIANKIKHISLLSKQFDSLIENEGPKSLQEILFIFELRSQILDQIDENYSRIIFCNNIKNHVAEKSSIINQMIKDFLSKTKIEKLTIQDIFTLILIYKDSTPLFDSTNHAVPYLDLKSQLNYEKPAYNVPALLDFHNKLLKVKSMIPDNLCADFFKGYEKGKAQVESRILRYYRKSTEVLNVELNKSECFYDYQQNFFNNLDAIKNTKDAVLDKYLSNTGKEKKTKYIIEAAKKLYNTFRQIKEANLPALSDTVTHEIRNRIFTDGLTSFYHKMIGILTPEYFNRLASDNNNEPPTIISLFEKLFLQLYPLDNQFLGNILNLLPQYRCIYFMNPDGEIGRIALEMYEHSLSMIINAVELKYSLNPPPSQYPKWSFNIDTLFGLNYDMRDLYSKLYENTINPQAGIKVPKSVNYFMKDYPMRVIKNLYRETNDSSTNITFTDYVRFLAGRPEILPEIQNTDAKMKKLKDMVTQALKANATGGHKKYWFSFLA